MNRRDFLRALTAAPVALVAARFAYAPPVPETFNYSVLKRCADLAKQNKLKPIRVGGQEHYTLVIHPSAAKRYGFRDGDLSHGFRLRVVGAAV